MIIGIDIGGTTTKIIGYKDKKIVSPISVKADDPLASAAGALGRFLSEAGLKLSEIRQVALTGVGAGRVGENIFDLPVKKVLEFEAIGHGGCHLADISKAIVVSMGTGTALVEVDGNLTRHWGGTGVGGGTLVGLSKYILGIRDVGLLAEKAKNGRLDRIDLTVGDIATTKIPGLPDSLTASNFGKSADDATESDQALAILNMVFQTIAVIASGAARSTGNQDVILVGRVATLPQAKTVFSNLSELMGIHFHFPKLADYAVAVGAAISV
jgi:type II pantothenate kinase